MMRAPRFILALLALVPHPRLVAAQHSPSEYSTLLASLKAGNTNIDYARLRLSYIDSPEYRQSKDVSEAVAAMSEAFGARNFPEALKNAEIVLANEYVNMDAHFVASVANREMGAAEKAEFHRTVFRRLVGSILSSGDGKSTEKAWVVISTHEEYVMLRFLGFEASGQSLLNKDGHSFDFIRAKKVDDGTEQMFYFNVDIPFKHYGP